MSIAGYMKVDLEYSRWFDGLRTTIKTMPEAGVRLGALSNKGTLAIAEALRDLGSLPLLRRTGLTDETESGAV
jgi:phosphoglycolate phosphatase-like HAD superfamily hydrolase